MRVQQVNERVREVPAQALRAMFAGIGSLLSATDKLRNKPAAVAEPETTATAEAAPAAQAAPAAEAVVAETAAAAETPEVPGTAAVPETTPAPEATAATETAPAPETAAALPLANYDEASIASLRARLRNLSAEQLGTLIEYEKSHANRAEVIGMFERRIAKLAEG